MQVSKHRRTLCTYQIRDCEFKESGCQFKVAHFANVFDVCVGGGGGGGGGLGIDVLTAMINVSIITG